MIFSISTILALAAASNAAAIFKLPNNVNGRKHSSTKNLFCHEFVPTLPAGKDTVYFEALDTDIDYVISQYTGPPVNVVTGGKYYSSASVRFQDKVSRMVSVDFALVPSGHNDGRLNLIINDFSFSVCSLS